MITFLMHHLRRFARAQAGATAIEYALIACGIGCAIIIAITALGGSVVGLFQTVANAFS